MTVLQKDRRTSDPTPAAATIADRADIFRASAPSRGPAATALEATAATAAADAAATIVDRKATCHETVLRRLEALVAMVEADHATIAVGRDTYQETVAPRGRSDLAAAAADVPVTTAARKVI